MEDGSIKFDEAGHLIEAAFEFRYAGDGDGDDIRDPIESPGRLLLIKRAALVIYV